MLQHLIAAFSGTRLLQARSNRSTTRAAITWPIKITPFAYE